LSLRPLEYSGRDPDGAPVFSDGYFAVLARVSGDISIARQHLHIAHILRDLDAVLLQQFEQSLEIMNEGEIRAASDEEGLDCFFGSLLSVKAQIGQVNVGRVRLGDREIAFRPAKPFARVVGRKAFWLHR
jgi:hypothetical protein